MPRSFLAGMPPKEHTARGQGGQGKPLLISSVLWLPTPVNGAPWLGLFLPGCSPAWFFSSGRSQGGKPRAGPRDTACSLECKFIGKNANDSFHFILPTDRAVVITDCSLHLSPLPHCSLCVKGPPPFRCIYSNRH